MYGKVVVPDRVVQAERLVAAAPLVARSRVLVEDDRRHAELAQARAEADPALAAADHDDVRLAGVAELLGLALALLEPGRAPAVGAVLHPVRPVRPLGLLVALELVEDGEQRPRLAVAQAQEAATTPDLRLERDPRLRDALGLARGVGGAEPARAGARPPDEIGDALRSLHGREVPGERDEVAPVAVVQEERAGGLAVRVREGLLERRQPGLGLLLGCGLRGDARVGHCSLLTSMERDATDDPRRVERANARCDPRGPGLSGSARPGARARPARARRRPPRAACPCARRPRPRRPRPAR